MALTCHGGGRETQRKALLCVSVALWLTGLAFMSNSVPAPIFREAAEETGLRFRHFTGATGEFFMPEIMGPGVAVFDYDGDGDLDVYLLQGSLLDKTKKASETLFPPPEGFKPGNRLFRNELVPSGKLRFTDVTDKAGVGHEGYGMGVAVGDYDNDGDPDLYVTNFGHNVLYRNNGAAKLLWIHKGNGSFEGAGLFSGAAYGSDGIARAGMGVTAGDFDNAGDDDILVTNLRREGSTLYRNDGRGFFYDATTESGLTQASFPYTGFGVEWFDYDNDGYLDLFVANGAVTILETLRGSRYPFHQRNQLFRNEGEGKKLVETSAGPAFQLSEVSRGAAFGDIDNDGDIDIVVSNNNGPARLLLNETGAQKPWLEVRLQGVKDNRSGLGARLALRRKGQKPLWRRAHADGSYLSANDCRVHFGLGGTPEIEALEVYWPCGDRELWTGIRAGTIVTLHQGTGKKID